MLTWDLLRGIFPLNCPCHLHLSEGCWILCIFVRNYPTAFVFGAFRSSSSLSSVESIAFVTSWCKKEATIWMQPLCPASQANAIACAVFEMKFGRTQYSFHSFTLQHANTNTQNSMRSQEGVLSRCGTLHSFLLWDRLFRLPERRAVFFRLCSWYFSQSIHTFKYDSRMFIICTRFRVCPLLLIFCNTIGTRMFRV